MATSVLIPLHEYLHTMYQRVQVATTRIRIPDICATRRSSPFEEIIRTPPLLRIEVLSPDDRMSDTQ